MPCSSPPICAVRLAVFECLSVFFCLNLVLQISYSLHPFNALSIPCVRCSFAAVNLTVDLNCKTNKNYLSVTATVSHTLKVV